MTDFVVREIPRGGYQEVRTPLHSFDEALTFYLSRLRESTGLVLIHPSGDHHQFNDLLSRLHDGQFHVDGVGPYLVMPTDLMRSSFDAWALGIDIEGMSNTWVRDVAAYNVQVRRYNAEVEQMLDLIEHHLGNEDDATSRFKHRYGERGRHQLRKIIGATDVSEMPAPIAAVEQAQEGWQRTFTKFFGKAA